MKNKHVRDKLSEYIDGMLSEEEASAVKKHLDHCPECMEDYEEMVKIIGHMAQIERLETPDFFVEKVHERMEKPSSIQRLIKGLFIPIKIKVPLELAGVAAAALLVIYIVGLRGKQHVYELAYALRSQPPAAVQEKAPAADAAIEEAITVIDEAAPQIKKAEPELKPEEEKAEKRDKRIGVTETFASRKKDVPALAPSEKRMERRAPVEDAVPQSKVVKQEEEVDLESHEETIERKAQIEAESPSGKKEPGDERGQKREKPSPEMADKEQDKAKKGIPMKLTYREERLEGIITALGGKIIESEVNKETQVLVSLVIEIPAVRFPKLIQVLEARGDIRKPYPAIKEKDQEIIAIRIILQQ